MNTTFRATLRGFPFVSSILMILAMLYTIPSLGRAESNTDQQAYEKLLNQANSELSVVSELRACPGISLTLSCGNSKCERNQGENEENCPQDCLNAPVQSYNGQTFCKNVEKIIVPQSPEEVAGIVLEAVKNKKHVRAIGHLHSTNELICSDGVVVSTEKLNRILGLETVGDHEVVTVEPGVRLSALTDWLHENGRSLGYHLVQYRGVTVAGALATGAHGSSTKHSSVLASAVEAMTWIGADGALHEAQVGVTDPDLFGALRTNLGMLGIIVKLKLRAERQFNLDTQLSYQADSELFKTQGVLSQVSECDFGQLLWFPHSKQFIKVCGNETQKSAQPGAENALLDPPVPNFVVTPYKLVMHYSACYPKLSCLLEDLRFATLRAFPPYRKTFGGGTPINVPRVTGYSHRMMTSELTGQRNAVNETDLEVAVPLFRAQEALAYISTQLRANQSCLPLVGLLIRFVVVDDSTLIGQSAIQGEFKNGEAAVLFELPVFSPVGLSSDLDFSYKNPYRQIALGLIRNFGGRAHWGKNDAEIFELQRDLGVFGDRLSRFKSVVTQLDPQGVFSNSFLRFFK